MTRKLTFLFLIIFWLFSSVNAQTNTQNPAKGGKGSQMYYEIKIYRVTTPAQGEAMDKYLRSAFIPAMHRAGISQVGVFKPIETDTAYGKIIYVFVPYKAAEDYFRIVNVLEKDKAYQDAGKDFIDAPYDNPPFARYESVFMKAFSSMPQYRAPKFSTAPAQRIYELRSYESATEAKALKKIEMFNEGGETGIFEKVGANAVFYAQVLLGSKKPRLMYLTTYADMKSHDNCWSAFRDSPEWKRISSMDEYKNTTTKTNAYLCHPTDYSDF